MDCRFGVTEFISLVFSPVPTVAERMESFFQDVVTSILWYARFANVATGDKGSIYASLGSIWLDGEIASQPDTDTWKVGASTKMVPSVTLSTSYAEAEKGNNGAVGTDADYQHGMLWLIQPLDQLV